MEKTLYMRPGAKDNAGNPVGFKAEPGSKAADALLADGYRPADAVEETETHAVESDRLYSEAELQALDLAHLRALGKVHKVRGYNILKEPALIEAILKAQLAEPAE